VAVSPPPLAPALPARRAWALADVLGWRSRALVTALLLLLAAALVWNVLQFPWRKGYDASAVAHYAEALGQHHRLPTRAETDVWHNPPLYFALAGALYRAGELTGLGDPGIPVQLFSAACVLGIVLLCGLIARELVPDWRLAGVAAALAAVATPVLVRSAVLFHPEPLAALLTTAGLYVAVGSLARGRLGLRSGAAAGLLLGLANLTRTWALAALAAALAGALVAVAASRSRSSVRFAAGLAGVSLLLLAPWLAVKAERYGSPFAYSQPNPEQWRRSGRPASFWLATDLGAVFHSPYQPWYRNHLLPTVYSDWVGDYWRAYAVPSRLHDEPDRLPARWGDPLVRQSWAGLVPLALTLVGAAGLALRAVRRRDLALATLLLSAATLLAMYAAFLARYPKQDGDNIKALYLLDLAPVAALAAAWGFRLSWGGSALRRAAVALAAAATLVVSASFLVLPPA